MRKPVYTICKQQRHKSVCALQSAHQCNLISAFIVVKDFSCSIQNFKTFLSFCSWAGQFESYLVANLRKQDFLWRGLFPRRETYHNEVLGKYMSVWANNADQDQILLLYRVWTLWMFVCIFGFNVAFSNFSVISGWCLVAAGSSTLTFIMQDQTRDLPFPGADVLPTELLGPVNLLNALLYGKATHFNILNNYSNNLRCPMFLRIFTAILVKYYHSWKGHILKIHKHHHFNKSLVSVIVFHVFVCFFLFFLHHKLIKPYCPSSGFKVYKISTC